MVLIEIFFAHYLRQIQMVTDAHLLHHSVPKDKPLSYKQKSLEGIVPKSMSVKLFILKI